MTHQYTLELIEKPPDFNNNLLTTKEWVRDSQSGVTLCLNSKIKILKKRGRFLLGKYFSLHRLLTPQK